MLGLRAVTNIEVGFQSNSSYQNQPSDNIHSSRQKSLLQRKSVNLCQCEFRFIVYLADQYDCMLISQVV